MKPEPVAEGYLYLGLKLSEAGEFNKARPFSVGERDFAVQEGSDPSDWTPLFTREAIEADVIERVRTYLKRTACVPECKDGPCGNDFCYDRHTVADALTLEVIKE